MKTKRITLIVLFSLFVFNFCFSQENTTKDNKLTVTGITIKKGDKMESLADGDKTNQVLEKVTKTLMADGLLTDDKKASYLLNNEKLVVNGVKQPEETHKKYKDEYLKDHTNWNICKNYKIE